MLFHLFFCHFIYRTFVRSIVLSNCHSVYLSCLLRFLNEGHYFYSSI